MPAYAHEYVYTCKLCMYMYIHTHAQIGTNISRSCDWFMRPVNRGASEGESFGIRDSGIEGPAEQSGARSIPDPHVQSLLTNDGLRVFKVLSQVLCKGASDFRGGLGSGTAGLLTQARTGLVCLTGG